MAITTLATGDTGSASRVIINDNFTDLDTTKADLASPALTGNPTAPTQSAGDNSTKLATTAYVDNVIADISCRVKQSSITSVTSGSYTSVAFQAEDFDTNTMHDNATNNSRITITTTGKYAIGATVQFTVGAKSVGGYLLLNNTTKIAYSFSGNGVNSLTGFSLSTIYSFTAGDYIEVFASTSSTDNTSGDTGTNFWAYKIN